MRYEALTIKDIAGALQLSISTVSKALRDSYEISEETKKLVKAYAEAHHYRPNPIAQSLKQGLSKSIGVIVCNIDNHFFSSAINGIESVAHQKGYNVSIAQSHESYEREVLITRDLSSRSIDGLIVSLSAETGSVDHFKDLHAKGLPLVFFDRVTPDIETHTIISGNYEGAYKATRHLIDQGYTRIAQITSSNLLSITLERLKGYTQALQDAGLPLDESYIKYCDHGGMIPGETEAALKELLALAPRPEAILTASDRLSTTSFSLLKSMGVAIPGEIALVGFTNSTSANIFDPPLTTVVQPAFEMGRQAMEMMIALIESKRPVDQVQRRVLENELIIRESSVKRSPR
jgi:LacI family transcriptional regulator